MKPLTPILVVDDDADVRELARLTLEFAGYIHISEARDGLEALRSLRDALTPVVVVCDFQMPRQNGMQLIDALTSDPKRWPCHACILMTCDDKLLTSANNELLQRHSVPVLQKPFDLDEFVDLVGRAADRLEQETLTDPAFLRPRVMSGPLAP